jgi:hypothetical protein
MMNIIKTLFYSIFRPYGITKNWIRPDDFELILDYNSNSFGGVCLEDRCEKIKIYGKTVVHSDNIENGRFSYSDLGFAVWCEKGKVSAFDFHKEDDSELYDNIMFKGRLSCKNLGSLSSPESFIVILGEPDKIVKEDLDVVYIYKNRGWEYQINFTDNKYGMILIMEPEY